MKPYPHTSTQTTRNPQAAREYDVRTSMEICIHIPEQQTTHDYQADNKPCPSRTTRTGT